MTEPVENPVIGGRTDWLPNGRKIVSEILEDGTVNVISDEIVPHPVEPSEADNA